VGGVENDLNRIGTRRRDGVVEAVGRTWLNQSAGRSSGSDRWENQGFGAKMKG